MTLFQHIMSPQQMHKYSGLVDRSNLNTD